MNQPEQPFQSMQRLPSEFTQADAMRLQQFNTALSQAKQQVDDGEITPEDGEVLTQGILRLRAPLLGAQEAQKALVKNQMTQQIQEDAALAQGMQQQDAVFRSQGLRERVSQITDPMTGQTAYLYEQSPNKWAQIEFGGLQTGTEGLEGKMAFGGGGFAGSSQPEDIPSGSLPVSEEPTSGAAPASSGAQPYAPELDPGKIDWSKALMKPKPEGGHTLEIWNGPNRQLAHFDGSGQIVRQEFFDRQGNPIQQGGQQGQLGQMPNQLDDYEIGVLRERAELMVPAVPPPEVQTPETMRMYHAAVLRRSQQVATAHRSLVNKELQSRQSQSRQSQSVDEHKRLEQVRVDREAKEKEAKEKEAKEKEHQARVDKYNTTLMAEAKEIAKEHYEATAKRMTRQESIRAAKEYLAELGITKPAGPGEEQARTSAQEDKARPEEVQKVTSALAQKARDAGDEEGVAAAIELESILQTYQSITDVPDDQRANVEALVRRVQRYRDGNKPAPMTQPPEKTQGAILNPSYRGGP